MVFRKTALIAALMGITSVSMAQAPVEDRNAPGAGSATQAPDTGSASQSPDTGEGIQTDITPAPDPNKKPKVVTPAPKPAAPVNPLLPTKDPSNQTSWLTQVNEIRDKYRKLQKQNEDEFDQTMTNLRAYQLTRVGKLRSKRGFIKAARRAKAALAAVKRYRANLERNRRYFLDAYNHINADENTRAKLIGILKKSFTTPKARAEDKLIFLEEQMFARLTEMYEILAHNPSLWDFRNGGFIFKNPRLKAKYRDREKKVNQSIRELQLHRKLATQTT